LSICVVGAQLQEPVEIGPRVGVLPGLQSNDPAV
jgi:hypothetical protein